MIALDPDRGIAAPCEPPPSSAHPFPGSPRVLGALAGRGVAVGLGPDEDEEVHGNRVATALMGLWRDTRDPEAFEALYAVSRGGVLAWIRGLMNTGLAHLDPSELLQDTFVNVYRYPGAFRDDHAGSYRVWVRTIAGNVVRRAAARRSRFSFQELPHGLQEPADDGGDPRRSAEAVEEVRRLAAGWLLFLAHYERAWRSLGQRDRRTLHLVEVEGLSYREAGPILNVGRSNMKMIVFRARKRIARHMRQAMGAREPLAGAA